MGHSHFTPVVPPRCFLEHSQPLHKQQSQPNIHTRPQTQPNHQARGREDLTLSVLEQADASSGHLLAYKLKLTSPSDLFFAFDATVDRRNFNAMQESQGLTTPFTGLPDLLLDLLERCTNTPRAFFVVLLLSPGGRCARLTFMQDLQFKFVELCSLGFEQTRTQTVQQNASDRYHALAAHAAALDSELDALTAFVRRRHPGLLLQFQHHWQGEGCGGEMMIGSMAAGRGQGKARSAGAAARKQKQQEVDEDREPAVAGGGGRGIPAYYYDR